MFIDQLNAAVEAAETPAQYVQLERTIWQAWSGRHVDDEAAGRLTETLHAKRQRRAEERQANAAPAGFCKPPRIGRIKGPKKAAAIARRRYLASCWAVPPDLAVHFTLCEQAALRIVADEIKTHGVCLLCHAAVAARAGTSVSVVKNMYRKARALRLLVREERRRRGQASLTNIVRPFCRRWLRWIRKHEFGCRPGRPGDRKNRNLPTTDYRLRKTESHEPVDRKQEALRGGQIAKSGP